jgi:hypothetical protein
VRALQASLIRGTHVIVGRIRLLTGRTIFHFTTPKARKRGNLGWPAQNCMQEMLSQKHATVKLLPAIDCPGALLLALTITVNRPRFGIDLGCDPP